MVAETEDGDWRIGSTVIPGTEWVRVRPDGKGLITLSDDAKHVHLRRNDGSIHKRIDLPGRFADAWVFERVAVVALRDGRLVPIPLQ